MSVQRNDTSRAQTPPIGRVRLDLSSIGEFGILLGISISSALLSILSGPVALRVAFGLPFVLFIPGYALVSALFPARADLAGSERIALSFGFSLALIPLATLAVEYSQWALSLGPIVIGLLVCTTLFSVVAVWRRGKIDDDDRATVRARWPRMPSPGAWDAHALVFALLLAGSIVLFGATAAVLTHARPDGDRLTEFALYSEEGKPEFYPREIVIGESASVLLEITNQEGSDESYWVRILSGGEEVSRVEGIAVANGDRWREPVDLIVYEAADRVPIELHLYRSVADDGAGPYRSLSLVVTGVEPGD